MPVCEVSGIVYFAAYVKSGIAPGAIWYNVFCSHKTARQNMPTKHEDFEQAMQERNATAEYETDDGGLLYLIVADGRVIKGWRGFGENSKPLTADDIGLAQHNFENGCLRCTE